MEKMSKAEYLAFLLGVQNWLLSAKMEGRMSSPSGLHSLANRWFLQRDTHQ